MTAIRDTPTAAASQAAGWPGHQEPPVRYAIRDVRGRLQATLLRYPGKSFAWRAPSGQSGLGDVGVQNLPLYLSETLPRIPYDTLLVLVEGPKAADALRRQGIAVVATITGAAGTPSREVLEVLRGRPVVLWADNDSVGRAHMRRLGERLLDIAAELWWIDTAGRLPPGGDAADVPPSDLENFLDLAQPFVATHPRVASTEDERRGEGR
jgi:hypothetical protein